MHAWHVLSGFFVSGAFYSKKKKGKPPGLPILTLHSVPDSRFPQNSGSIPE
jgi:hypothetical protein